MSGTTLFYMNDDAQGFQPSLPSMDDWKPRLHELLHNIRTGMLTTHSPDGELRSRPMVTLQVDEDGGLWFLASASSERTHDLDTDGHVSISYFVPEANRFISLSGFGTLIRDREKISELWRPEFREWFPEGENDPMLRMIRVQTTRAEAWSQQEEISNY